MEVTENECIRALLHIYCPAACTQVETYREREASLTEELARAQEEAQAAQATARAAQQEVVDTQAQLQAAEARIQESQAHVAALQQQARQLQQQVEQLAQQVAELQAEAASLQEALTMEKQGAEGLRGGLEAARAQVTAAEEEAAEAWGLLAARDARCAALEAESAALQDQFGALQDQLHALLHRGDSVGSGGHSGASEREGAAGGAASSSSSGGDGGARSSRRPEGATLAGAQQDKQAHGAHRARGYNAENSGPEAREDEVEGCEDMPAPASPLSSAASSSGEQGGRRLSSDSLLQGVPRLQHFNFLYDEQVAATPAHSHLPRPGRHLEDPSQPLHNNDRGLQQGMAEPQGPHPLHQATSNGTRASASAGGAGPTADGSAIPQPLSLVLPELQSALVGLEALEVECGQLRAQLEGSSRAWWVLRRWGRTLWKGVEGPRREGCWDWDLEAALILLGDSVCPSPLTCPASCTHCYRNRPGASSGSSSSSSSSSTAQGASQGSTASSAGHQPQPHQPLHQLSPEARKERKEARDAASLRSQLLELQLQLEQAHGSLEAAGAVRQALEEALAGAEEELAALRREAVAAQVFMEQQVSGQCSRLWAVRVLGSGAC